MTALFLCAVIGGQRVAIDAGLVQSVVDLGPVTPVPLAGSHIVGLCSVRSHVLTVIDAARAIGVPGASGNRRALVLDIGGHGYALQVDSVDDVIAAIGEPTRVDASIGVHWQRVASGTIDTPFGFALMIDPTMLVAGHLAQAA